MCDGMGYSVKTPDLDSAVASSGGIGPLLFIGFHPNAMRDSIRKLKEVNAESCRMKHEHAGELVERIVRETRATLSAVSTLQFNGLLFVDVFYASIL